jgi:hypothetical protein
VFKDIVLGYIFRKRIKILVGSYVLRKIFVDNVSRNSLRTR